MNVYIYDDYLNKGKYNKAINRMEIRLTDLGLNGKIIRLGAIKNISGVIKNEIKLGAKTIIAVGNNQTVNKVIGAIINSDVYDSFNKDTLLGIIPIGNDNSIATAFGIKNEEDACNILLARRIQKIDIGLVNKYYFLNQVSIESADTTIEIDSYSISTEEKGLIKIINLLSNSKEKLNTNPYDGLLDLYITTRKKDITHIKSNKIKINNPNHKLIVDDVIELETPITVGIIKNKLNVIVGKNRTFI